VKISIAIIAIGVIIFASHFFSGVFNKTKIPDTLWLFCIGLLLGPLLGFVSPATFGPVGNLFTAITLVVILFESGLSLHLKSLKDSWKGTFRLTLLNFIATVICVSSLVMYFTDLGILRSIILGSILGGTSSAVVIGLTKQLKLSRNAESILVVESALSDIFTLAIPIALITTYKSGDIDIPIMGLQMIASLVVALILGCLGALVWSILLTKIRTIENTHFTTAAFVFIIYGVVEIFGFSGPITALAFGVTLGNIDNIKVPFIDKYVSHHRVSLNQEEKNFFSEMVFLLRTFFFIYIGVSINLNDQRLLIVGLIITGILFLIRIPVVNYSISKSIPVRDTSFMAVMIPKGLGAAVLASLPLQAGITGGEMIQTITFSIILFSTVITTLMVFLIEKKTFVKSIYSVVFRRYNQNESISDSEKNIE
jgi:NhaP-type Na+/H+ or K+/H+ antiporter